MAGILAKHQSVIDLRLILESNEMGDECFETLMNGVAGMENLQKLALNISRNVLSVEALANNLILLAGLESLDSLDIDAKKNLKKIDEKDTVRQVVQSIEAKSKKIDL